MGGGQSSDNYVRNQENYVSQHFKHIKQSLPQGQYNDFQIKGKLREQYAINKTGSHYMEKDRWINDKTWYEAKRKM